jgi:Ca-activated chloride channel family protein
MKRLVVGLFLSLFVPVQASWFGYDRGIVAARDGDDERAVKLLTDELTSYPENPALLYDNGLLAARQKNYAQAEAFFSKTVEYSAPEKQLHRQALFNLGNACVGADKLREALSAYNQLLALDQNHEKARHNYDVVKKMLEQQVQNQEQDGSRQNNQEQNNSQQDNKKANQGNSKQQQSQGDQQQQQQGSGKSGSDNGQKSQQQNSGQQQGQQESSKQQAAGDKEQQQREKQESADQQKKQSSEQSSQDKQSSEKNDSSGEQSTEQKATDQQSSNSASPDGTSPDGKSCNQDNQKRDGKDSNQLDERDSYKKRYGKRDSNTDGKDKQQSGADKSKNVKSEPDDKEGGNDQRTQQHDDSPSRARRTHKDVTTTKSTKVGSKVQESAKKETKKQYAAWAESMLDAVQLNDEALNKVLVQRAVAGTMGGRDGECCW